MGVKKQFSSKHNFEVWGYDARIAGVRKQKFGFSSKGAAMLALSRARIAAFEQREGVALPPDAPPAVGSGRARRAKQKPALVAAKDRPAAPAVPFADQQAARVAQAQAALPAARAWLREAKALVKRQLAGEWREEVRRSYPQLVDKEIEMLPNEKPSVIALEYIARTHLGKSGRHLKRMF